MAKKLQRIELIILGELGKNKEWDVTATATITTGLEEYPEVPEWKKGIPITLTDAQKANISYIITSFILPQAETAK